jgi:hypothetical protein
MRVGHIEVNTIAAGCPKWRYALQYWLLFTGCGPPLPPKNRVPAEHAGADRC